MVGEILKTTEAQRKLRSQRSSGHASFDITDFIIHIFSVLCGSQCLSGFFARIEGGNFGIRVNAFMSGGPRPRLLAIHRTR
jgi:hypothetical protein